MTHGKPLSQVDSIILSDYIIYKYGPMSHLKLQKLLFYVDALHLAYFDTKIIEDRFEAWVHGPVSRKIFNELKDKSLLYDNLQYTLNKGEVDPETKLKESITTDQIDLVNEILEEYSKLSQFQLERLSHSEIPWVEARIGFAPADKCTKEIDIETTRKYYKAVVL